MFSSACPQPLRLVLPPLVFVFYRCVHIERLALAFVFPVIGHACLFSCRTTMVACTYCRSYLFSFPLLGSGPPLTSCRLTAGPALLWRSFCFFCCFPGLFLQRFSGHWPRSASPSESVCILKWLQLPSFAPRLPSRLCFCSGLHRAATGARNSGC